MSDGLRKARLASAITLQEVSIRSGVSRTTIEKAEKGKEAINIISATKIVRALNELAGTKHSVESLKILVNQ